MFVRLFDLLKASDLWKMISETKTRRKTVMEVWNSRENSWNPKRQRLGPTQIFLFMAMVSIIKWSDALLSKFFTCSVLYLCNVKKRTFCQLCFWQMSSWKMSLIAFTFSLPLLAFLLLDINSGQRKGNDHQRNFVLQMVNRSMKTFKLIQINHFVSKQFFTIPLLGLFRTIW